MEQANMRPRLSGNLAESPAAVHLTRNSHARRSMHILNHPIREPIKLLCYSSTVSSFCICISHLLLDPEYLQNESHAKSKDFHFGPNWIWLILLDSNRTWNRICTHLCMVLCLYRGRMSAYIAAMYTTQFILNNNNRYQFDCLHVIQFFLCNCVNMVQLIYIFEQPKKKNERKKIRMWLCYSVQCNTFIIDTIHQSEPVQFNWGEWNRNQFFVNYLIHTQRKRFML